MNLKRRINNPKFLFVYPPLQYAVHEMARPDGTLAIPYLDAAISCGGYESHIIDMSVGTSKDRMEDTFDRRIPISETIFRIGMSEDRILEEIAPYDVIAVTSIFTPQTSRCFEVAHIVKKYFPEKILIAGGVNARVLREHFFDNGFDVVFLSEGEKPIVQFARFLEGKIEDLMGVSGIAFRSSSGTVISPVTEYTSNIDEYPMPSWEKLPYEKYWAINRIWGGKEGWTENDDRARYASVFTSRGCAFRCTFCHISTERGGEAGEIGNLRLHSMERVTAEFDKLQKLGVDYVYINDDSFLAKKNRVLKILEILQGYRFKLADVNGVNIIHLFRREGERNRMVVDEELLAALSTAGFRKLSLPFESGSQRLIDKYARGKWNISRCDVLDLVRKIHRHGMVADGNFMMGYPDETLEELTQTFLLARSLMDEGLVGVNFFMVQPFPGSQLFEDALATGQLPKDWHWDRLGWSKEGTPFLKPTIHPEVLKYTWSLLWKILNPDTRRRDIDAQKASAPRRLAA